jgi:hypothetical protein
LFTAWTKEGWCGIMGQCYELKNIIAEKLAFLTQNTTSLCKKLGRNIDFNKKTPYFSFFALNF